MDGSAPVGGSAVTIIAVPLPAGTGMAYSLRVGGAEPGRVRYRLEVPESLVVEEALPQESRRPRGSSSQVMSREARKSGPKRA